MLSQVCDDYHFHDEAEQYDKENSFRILFFVLPYDLHKNLSCKVYTGSF